MLRGLLKRLVMGTASIGAALAIAGCGSSGSDPGAVPSTIESAPTSSSAARTSATVSSSPVSSASVTTGTLVGTSSTTRSIGSTPSPSSPPAVAEPDENGVYSWYGPGVISLGTPADEPSVLTLSCPSCAGPVTVFTDGYPPGATSGSGPYAGQVLLGATGGPALTTLTVTADAEWTASIAPLTAHPLSPPTSEGHGDAVLVLTDPATTATLGYEAAERFSMVIYQADGTSLTIHDIGPFHDSVAIQTPAIIAIVAAGTWSVATS